MPDNSPSNSLGRSNGNEPLPLGEMARLFPQYAILGLLGQGASATVYQALDVAEDRQLAIKIYPFAISADEPLTTRFAQRAPALVKFAHPHSVAVHHYGLTEDDHLFLVMDYVDGETLRHRLQTGGVTPAQALVVMEHVCDALHGAHGHGLMHWGLHPGSVFLDRHGGVKVGDFATARLALPGEPRSAGPEYLAPEQRPGQHVDHRADIFSVGVMLYEVLTGELPHATSAPASQRASVNPRIDAVIARAMDPLPEQRYQSSGELLRAIAAVRSLVAPAPSASRAPLPAVAANPHRSTLRKRTPVYIGYAAGAAVLAVLGYLAWQSGRKPAAPQVKVNEWPTYATPAPVVAATPVVAKAAIGATPRPVVPRAASVPTASNGPVGVWIPVPLEASKISGARPLEGGGVHLSGSLTLDRFRAKDIAVSVTVRPGEDGKVVQLWMRKDAASRVQMQLDGKFNCAIHSTKDNEFRGFGSINVPPSSLQDRWVTLRFAAIGDKLLGEAAGQAIEVKEVCDVLDAGMIGFASANADFKDLQVMILDEVLPERYPDFVKTALGIPDVPVVAKTPEPEPAVSTGPKASPEVEKWLKEVDASFQETYRRDVQAPFQNGVIDMFKGYLISLDKELTAASRAAKLDDALVWRNEKKRFLDNGQKVPLDDSDSPHALLTSLRVGMRRQFSRLDKERYERAQALFKKYDGVLSQNQALLTQAQRFDDAVRLKSKREEVAGAWLTAPLAAPPTFNTSPPSGTPKATPAPESPK